MERTTTVLSVVVAVVLLVAIIVVVAFLSSNHQTASTNPSPSPSGSVVASPTPSTAADGLVITDVKVGSGAEAVAGKSVTVNYTGTLADGTKFDSSYDRNQPFTFTLGQGDVIKGWDEGVVGMKVGGERKLVIPAALGYGAQTVGAIPANSTLYFDITLLSVQ